MFGWENADMARVYTRKAAQKKLAASGAAKVSLARPIVPLAVPPEEKDREINELDEGWHSLGELNPCFQIENLAS